MTSEALHFQDTISRVHSYINNKVDIYTVVISPIMKTNRTFPLSLIPLKSLFQMSSPSAGLMGSDSSVAGEAH